MNYNIIHKEGNAFKILNEINIHMFKNKDESINQQVLGKYVHEWDADKVLQRDNKFLICKTIEEATIVE